jgi:DNA polymerase
VIIDIPPDGFEAWRVRARDLVQRGVEPSGVEWRDASSPPTLFDSAIQIPPPAEAAPAAGTIRVPSRFLSAAAIVACHSDPQRWNLLYRMLWKIVREGATVLEDPLDDDVRTFDAMRQQVGRDEHRMHAYLRFRKLETDDRYVAWYRPDHHILRLAVPFFIERFGSMRWSILTPDASAHWDLREIVYGPGMPVTEAPREDQLEDLWQTYYGSIFNPARTNLPLLKQQVPTRFWGGMPETRGVAKLVDTASSRVQTMVKTTASAPTARPFVPEAADLSVLENAARACEGCDLYKHATQTVFGEGPQNARIVLVGEQPGDQEDVQGRPFVGPAGEILSRALADAGIERSQVYVTNAVKHFKFEPRGKRRIHQAPRMHQIRACRPWVEAEIHAVRPRVLVCLGATAAQSLIGPQFRITKGRGQRMRTPWAEVTVATYHPSAVLRADSEQTSAEYYAALVADLRLANSSLVQTLDGANPSN